VTSDAEEELIPPPRDVAPAMRSLDASYGAVHIEAAYCVHRIRKVSFAPISYSFSRNASFDKRNISSEPILMKLKTDGLFRVQLSRNLACGEKMVLAPIDSKLQPLSRENIYKINKNVFKSGSDAQNGFSPALRGCFLIA